MNIILTERAKDYFANVNLASYAVRVRAYDTFE
jgi:hypothetical protein